MLSGGAFPKDHSDTHYRVIFLLQVLRHQGCLHHFVSFDLSLDTDQLEKLLDSESTLDFVRMHSKRVHFQLQVRLRLELKQIYCHNSRAYQNVVGHCKSKEYSVGSSHHPPL